MNESEFTRTINREVTQLLGDKGLSWKINDMMNAGRPDNIYMGNKDVIFIEYKLIKKPGGVPMRIRPALTEQQKLTLERMHYIRPGSVYVAVIVSITPREHKIILFDCPLLWNDLTSTSACQCLTRKELAAFIVEKVTTKGHGE